jgi:cell wall-associated NlpC family hydrolase
MIKKRFIMATGALAMSFVILSGNVLSGLSSKSPLISSVLSGSSIDEIYGSARYSLINCDESYEEKLQKALANQKAIQEKKKETQNKLNELNQKKDNTLEYLQELDKQMELLEAEIEETKKQISDTQLALEQTKVDLVDAQNEEAEQYESMKRRIKYIYENDSNSTVLDIFLNSRSLAELLNEFEYSRKITEYDNELLDKYVAARQKVEQRKATEEAQLGELIAAADRLDYNEAQLADLIVESNKTLDEYLAAIESGKVTLANYGDQEAAVKQQIETIKENERKRIEEEKRREAARKAAEEATRKAAEEEAKRAAEAAAAANQPTTTTANNVTVADQPATTAATTQPVTVAADPAPVSTGTKASIRAAIANEAPKYLGLKYVWGGTSLSTGADCSGFCWAIYKKCGVDISGLQRTSYGMASQSLGRTVSVSEAQPGDLVFYGDSYGNVNHVAIYIGNNTIIHESGYQVGCKKSSIYYRNIIKIKNFIDYL